MADQTEIPETRCTDGCGAVIFNPDPEVCGWEHLQITGRWRCPACAQQLRAINDLCKDQEKGPDPAL